MTAPALPVAIRDELLDLYAFLFCQGVSSARYHFRAILLVACIVKPGGWTAKINEGKAA
jgi:hypothetical protein